MTNVLVVDCSTPSSPGVVRDMTADVLANWQSIAQQKAASDQLAAQKLANMQAAAAEVQAQSPALAGALSAIVDNFFGVNITA